MPALIISDFSCIKDVSFELQPINVIIGPQGSGKSVTTKLFYFFSDILNLSIQYAERGESLDIFKKSLSKQFCIWFPPSAWGRGRFNIIYNSGDFSIRILRRIKNNQVSEDISIKFSEYFHEFYSEILEIFGKNNDLDDLSSKDILNSTFDRSYRYRELAVNRLSKRLGDDFLANQTFIPAGRAFFTSIGRLVAGFEQAGSLDPVTIKFARLFANLRDRGARRYLFSRRDADLESRRNNFMTKLFGGEVKFEDEFEFVETIDGRKVPFSALSSGQQELLPMWSLMDYIADLDHMRSSTNTGGGRRRNQLRELIYIEEPEAHLFPSAQSLLMEFLIGTIVSEKNKRSLIITTHSPYIMSKLNVFLKAGNLSRRKKRNEKINEVVPRDCWIQESQLSAFALHGGSMVNLIDEYGLIDGLYLDSVSEDISIQFSKLLMIEDEIVNG